MWRIKYLGDVYEYLCHTLPSDLLGIVEMFHMKTQDRVKQNILKSFTKRDGHVRVVLCSTSFSMGLNLRDVPYVIHYGPSNDTGSYLQETGRAARDKSVQRQAILMKYPRCYGSSNVSLRN